MLAREKQVSYGAGLVVGNGGEVTGLIAGVAALGQWVQAPIFQISQHLPSGVARRIAAGAREDFVQVAQEAAGLVDLKLQGAAIFVDAARIYALSHGINATNTRERLVEVGPLLGLAASEYEAWVGAFEFLQTLRLRVQLEGTAPPQQPNHIRVDSLNNIDRRILREAFRVGRSLQQRLQLDYER